MKQFKLFYLIMFLPLSALIAQGEQGKPKTKYIIKKVTVENIDGKETQKEEIDTVDFMSTKTAYLNGLLKEIYLKMLDFIPNLYEFLYNFTAGRLPGFSVQSLLAMAMKRNMEGLIRQYEADIVICTHPFPCAAASSLKKSGRLEALLVGVITDFSVHQMWVYENIELLQHLVRLIIY